MCKYCEILKNGRHIGGNKLYKILAYNGQVYGIWNKHINLKEFPFCSGKLTTMKIDTRLKSVQELGSENLKWRQMFDEHIAYVFERQ